jgi:hypothetical protein
MPARLGRAAARAARDAAAGMWRTRPDFLIIGTQKAGTTSLHAYLAAHPGLQPARGRKELHYFNIYYHRGLAWYLGHFPTRLGRDGRLRFEATPDYLWHPAVPARVARQIGRPKLIAVLRDPAERAYSAWNMWHSFAGRADRDSHRADPRSFSQAIAEELASPDGQAHLHFHYLAQGRYADHLARWLGHFRREDLLVLEHAEMSRDLPAFLDRICAFLGVDRFDPATVRDFAGTRHWAGPRRTRTADDEATLVRLRTYYAPHDAALARVLDRPPSWSL